MQSLRAALSAAEAALASAEALAERRAAEAEAHRRRAETERQAMEEARRKKARAEERLAGILAEVRAYEAAERTGAGFQEGVRAVLKAAEEGRLSGIHGPVLTLFSVPEALTTAIDVVLGPAAMNIVVADEASAHAAIDYLKRGRLGRATFLPLDVLRARANPAEFEALRREMPGVLGPASELVESAPAYAVVRRFLLGGVLVVETLDTATAAARRLGYRHRIVTLDGELLHPGGSLTGGSSAKKSGAFTAREQAYAQFRAARRAAEAALAEAEAAYAQAAASYEAAVQEASAAAERLVAARRALAEAQAATDAARRQAEDAQAAVDRLSDADRVAEAEVQEMQRSLEEAAEEARRAQAASDSAYAALKALEAAALERDHDASTKRARLAEVELSVARLEAALAAEQRLLDDKRAQLAAWEAEAEELLREAERLSQEDAEDRLRAEEVRAVLAEVRARRDRLSEDRMRLYAERESVRARVGVVETALEEQQRTIAALTATLAEDRLKAERAGDVLDRHLKHLGEVHERTYEAAREDARTLTAAEIDEVRRALREKKAELDAFGTVNVGAVEDAERLGARLAFYRTQLHDLDAAKAKLSRLIEEIDEEMRVRFWEAFQAIRRAYQETFERLFGGGKADLALEGDDPLTAGIDILAQPPGKKTRRLSLLSGGERALSAIALLFAVLSVRPVPFCVLDEVDAARGSDSPALLSSLPCRGREQFPISVFRVVDLEDGLLSSSRTYWRKSSAPVRSRTGTPPPPNAAGGEAVTVAPSPDHAVSGQPFGPRPQVLTRPVDFHTERAGRSKRPVGLAEQLSAQKHDVGLPGADDGIGLRRRGNPTDGTDGDTRQTAHFRRKARLIARRFRNRFTRHHEAPRAHIHQIRPLILKRPGNLHRIRQRKTARSPIHGREADEHGAFFRPFGPYRLHHFQKEAHPVPKIASIGVLPSIGKRREKFVQQVTVGSMNFDHVETGLKCSPGRARERFNDARKLIGREFPRHRPVLGKRNGGRGHRLLRADPFPRRPSFAAGVGQLNTDGRAMGVNKVDDARQRLDVAVVIQAEVRFADPSAAFDGRRFQDDQSDAADGPSPVVDEMPVRGPAVRRGTVLAHRRHDDTVFQRQAPKRERIEQSVHVSHLELSPSDFIWI
ncbi:MAG: hypothetical protein IMW86_02875 [Hydrogenibacillus sp.]|nr:hypothetical protein [Hydrogenibacillus sp.]